MMVSSSRTETEWLRIWILCGWSEIKFWSVYLLPRTHNKLFKSLAFCTCAVEVSAHLVHGTASLGYGCQMFRRCVAVSSSKGYMSNEEFHIPEEWRPQNKLSVWYRITCYRYLRNSSDTMKTGKCGVKMGGCKFHLAWIFERREEFNVYGSVHRNNILIFIQQDATLHSLFYLETALHVLGGTITHHQECKQLYLQHLVFVTL
jgi:hypothetical protein